MTAFQGYQELLMLCLSITPALSISSASWMFMVASLQKHHLSTLVENK